MTQVPKLLKRTLTLTTATSLSILGVATLSSPSYSYEPDSWNPFQVCAIELVNSNISHERAAQACASALEPKDLSFCTMKINSLTPVDSNIALAACFRVRRPVELASCVVDINEDTDNPVPLAVVDYCRRSLLPIRYAECVIGLDREINFSTSQAMETCISAEDFPGVLYRTGGSQN